MSVDGLPQGCHSAPLASSLGIAKSTSVFGHIICNARGIPATHWQAVRILRYFDDRILTCPPDISDEAYQLLRGVLTQDGMILHEDTCIAFSSDGTPPTQPMSRRLWDNANHRDV